jgi:hypothetical protein
MGVLRVARFRRYFVGQATSLFGDSLVPLTIAFAALHVAGPDGLGVVLAANRVPIAVLVLFGGVLGDRWNRRLVMVAASLAAGSGQRRVDDLHRRSGPAGPDRPRVRPGPPTPRRCRALAASSRGS